MTNLPAVARKNCAEFTLYETDCRIAMDLFIQPESCDSMVTDPPYGIGFMGKGWDHRVPDVSYWLAAYRALKPGAYLVAFGGARTYHRLVCAIEDAGFEIRDQIFWVFGSGFPKSHNGDWGGTALKPAHEPICIARKPLIGTVAKNFELYGTGGLNIDDCRVETDENLNGGAYAAERQDSASDWAKSGSLHKSTGLEFVQPSGRWPANLIHDGSDEVLAAFPAAPGQMADASSGNSAKTLNVYGAMRRASARSDDSTAFQMKPGARRLDSGSAARFFYCAKASKADRNEGGVDNRHPTVKPTALMQYLIRLVTPHGGVCLDAFAGSGSTGKAAMREGIHFIGCENDRDNMRTAEARIRAEQIKNS